MTDQYHFETLAIHAGQKPDPTTGAVIPPIYQTSTFVQTGPGRDDNKGYLYSRVSNPTRAALEKSLAALEGAQYGLAFPSGMAAIDTLIRLLPPGSHLAVGDDIYGGTMRLIEGVLLPAGYEFSFVDMTDPTALEQAIRPDTGLVWLETPTNPTLKVVDIVALSEIAHRRNIPVAVDNTFASPYLQQPLALGADFAVHSATKYLGGHSDLVAGTIMLNDEHWYERLKDRQYITGAILGPQDCWLLLRGIKTLPVRMDRHCQNALSLARWLSDHPAVAQVHYPGLPDHPQHELARRQMKDFGGMISMVLEGGLPAAKQFLQQTRLFLLAVSLGGVESLVELPATMTHSSGQETEFAVDPALIRVSVGIENLADLQADLAQALA